jgi:transposase, IS5 family
MCFSRGQALKKRLKRRSAIEPVIGHMKSDGRMARYFLQGVQGDAVNALLCAATYNLRKILAKLRFFCTPMRSVLRLAGPAAPSSSVYLTRLA